MFGPAIGHFSFHDQSAHFDIRVMIHMTPDGPTTDLELIHEPEPVT